MCDILHVYRKLKKKKSVAWCDPGSYRLTSVCFFSLILDSLKLVCMCVPVHPFCIISGNFAADSEI